jgi:hypothetical protein
MKYLVISPGEREIVIEAKNSTQAKRKACRFWGIKPNDEWCGITALTARRMRGLRKEGRGCSNSRS